MKLFYADTETTGLDPKVHEVFQFSFIIEIDGKVVEEADIEMRPDRPDEASPEALKVTNKTIKELKAYPELAPVTYRLPPAQVFEHALDVARGLGWEIVAAVPAEGRIEATERSFWFGFTDDMVIRVRTHPDGAQVDIRSASRVGESDLGVNARRITAFINKLVAGSVQ